MSALVTVVASGQSRSELYGGSHRRIMSVTDG
jgi:hypothetical protein